MLAGTVETAVNALWDAAPLLGDRVAVVGAGMVGCCVARLLAGIPGVRVTLVDADPTARRRRATPSASASPIPTTHPAAATWSCTPARPPPASRRSLDLLGAEGEVVDLSWYGDAPVELTLGGAFHSGRLAIRASQVGAVAPARRGRRTPPTGSPWRSTCCTTRRSTPCSPGHRRSTSCRP